MKFSWALLLAGLPALAGYTHCQPIVIHHGLVSNTDQASYVLTVADTNPGLADAVHGGYAQSPDGYDIVFSADPLGQIC